MIKIPVTSIGEPDFLYMEEYMKRVEATVRDSLTKLLSAKEERNILDVSEWKEFRISDIFELKLSKGDNKEQILEDGNIPLVSAGASTNGICKFIAVGDGISKIFPKGSITVDMFGSAFYQPEDFFAVSHGRVNILQPVQEISENVGIYMTAILNAKLRKKYGFTTMCSQGKLKYETILLPATSTGEPDYDYMGNYMKSKKESCKQLLKGFRKTI